MLNIFKKFIEILDLCYRDGRKVTILITLGLVTSALFEMLSLGALIPIISIVFSETETGFSTIDLLINSYTYEQKLIYLAITLFIVFLFKSIYQTVLYYYQGKYTANLSTAIGNFLYKSFINLDYLQHIKDNSSKKIQYIGNESNTIVQGYLRPIMVVFTEVILILGICGLLIFIDPTTFFVSLIFFAISFGILNILFVRKLSLIGKERASNEIYKTKEVQQTLFGFKLIKLTDSEKYFFNKFKTYNFKLRDIKANEFFLKQLPRPWFELLIVSGVIFLVYYLYYDGQSLSQIQITLTVYLAAIVRMMPSFLRVVGSIQSINFFSRTVELLHDDLFYDLKEKDVSHNKRIDGKYITIDKISFKYPETDKFVLKDIDLELNQNEFIGIVGESGSGKSTFISILLGILNPDSGGVYFQGQNITELGKNWRNKLGYVPQDIYMLSEPLRNNIAFGLKNEDISDERVKECIELANLQSFVSGLNDGIDTILGENAVNISGGQKQRIAIARALYFDPEILIFDEATSSLDSETEKEILSVINELSISKTIFFCSHKKSILNNCSQIYSFSEPQE